MAEARRLSSLPVPQLKRELQALEAALGVPLRKEECDSVLKNLAILMPRANLSPDDAHTMLDLYFQLLSRAGVTGKMLRSAAERFVMAPNEGKAKWFPDPGQLRDLCADDIKTRRQKMLALEKANQLLALPPPADDALGSMAQRLNELGDRMRVVSDTRRDDEETQLSARIKTGRDSTDAAELKAAIAKKVGVTVEDIERRYPPRNEVA